MKRTLVVVVLALLLASGLGGELVAAQGPKPPQAAQAALGSAFTYQGQLTKNGAPVTGSCNLQFTLFADAAGTITVAGPVAGSPDPVTPNNGLFTVQIDFGAGKFDGTGRWLRVAAKCAGDGGFTPMSALQPLTPAPYALVAQKAASYANVITVAPSGANFTSIQAALNSITTNSATIRFLVWVGPGTYAETVTMKPYVDIEGAGEDVTTITQVGSANGNTGTVVGANNAELRFLTVENTGGAAYAIAIYNQTASPRLTHVTATASGGSVSNYGVVNISSSPTMTEVTATASGTSGSANHGVYNASSSSPTMTNVTATASGGSGNNYGVRNTGSSPTMTNVTATASGTSGSANQGVYNTSSSSPTMISVVAYASGGLTNYGLYNEYSSVTVQNSTITAKDGNSDGIVNTAFSGSYTVNVNNSVISAGTSTIYNLTNSYTVKVGASQLIGIGGQGLGTYLCIFSYNQNYAALNSSTCQ